MTRVDSDEVKAYVAQLDEPSALRLYDSFSRYLAYENTIFWTRAQHFLVAHGALLALFGAIAFGKNTSLNHNITNAAAFILCSVGIVLSILWHKALTSGEFWTGHWQDILREVEPKALGPIPAFRRFESGRPFVRAVGVARHCAWLFSFAWVGGGVAFLILL